MFYLIWTLAFFIYKASNRAFSSILTMSSDEMRRNKDFLLKDTAERYLKAMKLER